MRVVHGVVVASVLGLAASGCEASSEGQGAQDVATTSSWLAPPARDTGRDTAVPVPGGDTYDTYAVVDSDGVVDTGAGRDTASVSVTDTDVDVDDTDVVVDTAVDRDTDLVIDTDTDRIPNDTGDVADTGGRWDSGDIDTGGANVTPASALQAGDLVITEVMSTPEGCTDQAKGEYVEVYNTTSNVVDLAGLILRVDGRDVEVLGAGVSRVPSHSYRLVHYLLGGPSSRCLRLPQGAVYLTSPAAILSDVSVDVSLIRPPLVGSPAIIDSVVLPSAGSPGVSLQLVPGILDATLNDLEHLWCEGDQPILGTGTNLGTPGQANACAEPVIDTSTDPDTDGDTGGGGGPGGGSPGGGPGGGDTDTDLYETGSAGETDNPADTDADTDMDTALSPGFELSASTPRPGGLFLIEALRAAPGEPVYFYASLTGTGSGTCVPSGSLCTDLDADRRVGVVVANAAGVALLQHLVPTSVQVGTDVYLQAVTRQGRWESTNVVRVTVMP